VGSGILSSRTKPLISSMAEITSFRKSSPI
jgi:hypothetical protein